MKLYIVRKYDGWFNYGDIEEEKIYINKDLAEQSIAGKNRDGNGNDDWYEIIETTTEDK